MAKKQILIVEDEAVAGLELQMLLTRAGYDVPVVAATGEDAVRCALERRPDMILMDVSLQGAMNGIQAAEEIWKSAPIPVVFLTAHTDVETLRQAQISGLYGYLTKPCDLNALRNTVETALFKGEMDARLREQEALYRRLVENIPGIVYAFSTTRGGVYYSPHVEAVLGYSAEYLYANPLLWHYSIHPDDLARVKQIVGETEAGKPFRVEYRISDSRGKWHWFDDRSYGYRSEGTETIVEGFALDITERKLAEEALQEKNAELERLTYTVSHDLKSPLITFHTYLGYLAQDMEKADKERIAEDLGFMRTAADKMTGMLGEILELSRIGRAVSLPAPATVRELVEDARAAVAGQLAESGAVLSLAGPELTLVGDRHRLARIWQNLLDNAVKYASGHTPPRIEIGTAQERGETVFFVRDNGRGIDPKDCGRVFGLFVKLDGSSSGSGIGLAVVKRIVELYNGRIWVESDGPGTGSCFKFTLPKAVKGN